MNDFPYILIVTLISGALFGLIFVAHISLLFVFKEDLYKKNNLLFIRLVTFIIIGGFLFINFITFIFVIFARLVLEIGILPYKPEHKKFRKEVQKRGAVDGDLYMIKEGEVVVPYTRIIIKNKRL